MDKELFADLVASIKEMKEVDARAVREMTGLSQAEFARVLQVSKGTLLNWEQGRRSPTGPARALLRLRAVANDAVHVVRALNG